MSTKQRADDISLALASDDGETNDIGHHDSFANGSPQQLRCVSRYACPCCGYLSLDEEPPGTFLMCEVCWWEDDPVQFDDPNYSGGANAVSLRQARENFQRIGASDPRSAADVRAPRADEVPSA